MCVQEVIGKSVKQAVFLPLYTAPDGYGLTFFKYVFCILYIIPKIKLLNSVFFPPIFLALKTRHAFSNFHLCM